VSLLLLRDADVWSPEPLGRRDVLCAGGKIVAIADRLDPPLPAPACEVVELAGAIVVPGLVDAHVHVGGGGGEAGFCSRVPPLRVSDLSTAGVTSVVGLLGTDVTTRTMRDLVARTLGLREEGLSAWCWTGGYAMPPHTLTGRVRDDVAFVDPVVGVGELAISDHRSSQPTLDELLRVAADVHVAAMTARKAGVVHLHVGDGPRGLDLVRRALELSELPARVFHPTHVNRNPSLFDEALALARVRAADSPFVDVTAFPDEDRGDALAAADAIARWHRAGLPPERITCSSDGGGCLPRFDADGRVTAYGVGRADTLLPTIRAARDEHGLPLGAVLAAFTRNVAALLRRPEKGRVGTGADADLLVLEADLSLRSTISGGSWRVRDGHTVACGPFG
jgi:beta-aspartyl-dipeptidase (metallo-type)